MAITTKHKYIDNNPIKDTDKYLILGTIHPHRTEDFKIDFFYGNAGSLWKILSDACTIELHSKEQILEFLNTHKIAVSDMILECERCNETITKDSELCPSKFNEELKEQILKSNISTIFFTSSFNKNNAAKLFFSTFNLTTQIPKTWQENYEFDIELEKKTIRCIILLSPSGAANIGIANSKAYKKTKENNQSLTVTQYRIDFYKDKICKTIDS
ncbi:hypothetical protein KKA17_06855 [bacterium]|nr:hypothetical protein [bacterium]MBU1884332.1 hypothetical protein [bacterium]